MTQPTNLPPDQSSMTTPTTAPTTPAGPVAPTPPATATAAPAAGRPRRKSGVGRVIKWAFLLLLLLLIGGGVFLWLNLNSIVERTVESQATSQLNLKTELDGAAVSIFGGQVSLDELKIASPQGFTSPQMFSLADADVKANLRELRGDPVRVQSVTLNRPKLVIESQGRTFNFKKAMDLMPKQPEKPADASEPLRVVIGELTVKEPTVVVRPAGLNIPGIKLPEEITVSIPTISMKNIGTSDDAQNGAAIKDVVMQVITAMAAQAANSRELPPELQNLLNVDVQQVVANLTAEAQKRVAEALPGEAGRIVSAVIADPQALLKNPGQVVGAQVGQLREQAQQEAQRRVEGLVGQVTGNRGGATQPSTQPATQPADRVRQEAERAVQKGLEGLLNRDRDRDRDRSKSR